MSNSHPLRPLSSAAQIDHMHLLSEQLGALLPGEEYSDVTLVVEEKRFPAHRVILAARCHYFRYWSEMISLVSVPITSGYPNVRNSDWSTLI